MWISCFKMNISVYILIESMQYKIRVLHKKHANNATDFSGLSTSKSARRIDAVACDVISR